MCQANPSHEPPGNTAQVSWVWDGLGWSGMVWVQQKWEIHNPTSQTTSYVDRRPPYSPAYSRSWAKRRSGRRSYKRPGYGSVARLGTHLSRDEDIRHREEPIWSSFPGLIDINCLLNWRMCFSISGLPRDTSPIELFISSLHATRGYKQAYNGWLMSPNLTIPDPIYVIEDFPSLVFFPPCHVSLPAANWPPWDLKQIVWTSGCWLRVQDLDLFLCNIYIYRERERKRRETKKHNKCSK